MFSLSSDKIYAKAKIKVKFFDSLNFQQEIAIHLSNQYSTRLHKHSSDHQKHFYYCRRSSCHSSLRGIPLHPLTQHFAHQTSADYFSVLTFSNNIFIIQEHDHISYDQICTQICIFGHIWHIWARQIWSSGVSLRRSCKMQFTRVGLKSIGPSSQKL